MGEVHDPAGEPGAENRHAGFGQRLIKTENLAWSEALAHSEKYQHRFPAVLAKTALVVDSTNFRIINSSKSFLVR